MGNQRIASASQASGFSAALRTGLTLNDRENIPPVGNLWKNGKVIIKKHAQHYKVEVNTLTQVLQSD
jgi:hypothetical protein